MVLWMLVVLLTKAGASRGLRKLLMKHSDFSPAKLMNAIISDVDDFKGDEEQFDDLTVLVWKWIGP